MFRSTSRAALGGGLILCLSLAVQLGCGGERQEEIPATATAPAAPTAEPSPPPPAPAPAPPGVTGAARLPLRVCLEDSDPPRSQRSGERGFDLDVMREVAARAELQLQVVWIPSAPKVIELEESSFPLRALRRGRCAAIPSVPGPEALGEDARQLHLSRPYYGAGFELITGADAALPTALGALRGRRISVMSTTVAHLAAVRYGMDWRAEASIAQQLQSLDTGQVEGALIFGPALAPRGRTPRSDFSIPPALRWNFHVATRRGRDPELAARIDTALDEMLRDDRIAALLHKYGIPAHPPFATTSSRETLRELGPDAAETGS